MHPYVVLRESFRAIRSTLRTALLNHSAATYQTPRPGSERLAQCEPASWEEMVFFSPVHLLRHAEKENITEIKQIWELVPGVPPYLLTFHSFAKQNDCQSEVPADKSLWIATVGRDFNVQISFFFSSHNSICTGRIWDDECFFLLLFLLNTSEGGKDRTCRKTGLSLKSEAQKDLKTLAAGRPSGGALMTTSNKRRER